MSQIKTVNLSDKSASEFSAATVTPAGQLIHVAGQIGATKDGHIPHCYESQIHLALLKLRRIIVTAGGDVDDISKMNVHIVAPHQQNGLHERHIQRFLGLHRPAITVIPVISLVSPSALIEIDAVLTKRASSVSPPSMKDSMADAAKPYDVIVVGAGLSGLTAANEVTKAGLTCLVLEARDRVGGKTLSSPMKSGGMCEFGGAWINDTTESRMAALCKKYGAETIETNTNGNGVLQDLNGGCNVFPYGEIPPFDQSIRDHLDFISHAVEDDCQKVDTWNPRDSDLDSLTFTSYLRRKGASELAIETCGTWTRAMMGQEPSDISALYFLNYCKSFGGLLILRSDEKDGGQYLRVKQGVQMLSKCLAAELPKRSVRLAHPVLSVHQTYPQDLVQVTTPSGAIAARKVILSVPSAVLKTIDFQPSLPVDKIIITDSFNYGYYTKVMLAFKSPFWIERGFCGLAQSFLGPVSIVRDVSTPSDGKWILVCFLSGEKGRKWALSPPEERHEQLLSQLATLFADRETIDREFLEAKGYDWSTERYSGWGCPSASLPPGVLDTVGDALRTPVGNIHFIGHETAGEFKGFMEGAVRSGERGADEVISALQKPTSKL